VACGFTLVEVLVAVLVFGLLAATAYTGLNAMIAATGDLRQRSVEFTELQRTVARLDLDLRQVVSRTGLDGQGRTLPALLGDRQSLLARRAGRINPGRLAHSSLLQFRWQSGVQGPVRETWGAVDDDPGTTPFARQTQDAITAIEFRYLDASGSWHAQWPAGGPPEQLPVAVEYVLQSPRFGPIRRLIAL
ncbi:MAG: type II secretion system minor pseudopilin GspJ, partial [Wenzhouxiangellaceae bacterium]